MVIFVAIQGLRSGTQQGIATPTTTKVDVEGKIAASHTVVGCLAVTSHIQRTPVLSYKKHLQILTKHPIIPTRTPPAPEQKTTLPTPVNPVKLSVYLKNYDLRLRNYLIDGFVSGFSISSFSVTPLQPSNNLHSAYQHPQIVSQKLHKETSLGRIAGPYSEPPLTNMVFSPLGLQPKKAPGQFRVIHHLSFPKGRSINDGIPRDCATVKYATVGQAIKHILSFGTGCYLAKTDIKSAFRIIPVNPADYHLLGFHWEKEYYYDRCLPMGCSSSCAIFEAFSTALEWIISNQILNVSVLHILDDFLFIASSYRECYLALDKFRHICQDIGVPLAPEKTMGPSQALEFAGIYLDSIDMSASLPLDKIIKFRGCIQDLMATKSATLKQIQSLTGMLNFACGVIAPGRAFSRRLYDLAIGLTKPYHHRKITNEVRRDLTVWNDFLTHFNRKTFFLDFKFLLPSTLHMYTDASTSVGYGGFWGSKWFSGIWPDKCLGLNIALLEIYPICLAIKLWGTDLANKCIMFNSDNMAVVHIINTFTSKDKNIMSILRIIVLDCMRNNILIKCTHIPGKINHLADLLSRDQVLQALQLYPHLQSQRTSVPRDLQLDHFLRL